MSTNDELYKKVKNLENLLLAFALCDGGPIPKLWNRIQKQLREPKKVIDVILGLYQGKTTAEIADNLDLSERTIRDKLQRVNAITSGYLFGLTITQGKPGRGHKLTTLGEFLAKYLEKIVEHGRDILPLDALIQREEDLAIQEANTQN